MTLSGHSLALVEDERLLLRPALPLPPIRTAVGDAGGLGLEETRVVRGRGDAEPRERAVQNANGVDEDRARALQSVNAGFQERREVPARLRIAVVHRRRTRRAGAAKQTVEGDEDVAVDSWGQKHPKSVAGRMDTRARWIRVIRIAKVRHAVRSASADDALRAQEPETMVNFRKLAVPKASFDNMHCTIVKVKMARH